jgi:hypothetical protein
MTDATRGDHAMRCAELTERIADRFTGDLDSRRQAALDEHLASCPSCAAEAVALESLWKELAAGEPVPSARMRARFDRELERATDAPSAAPESSARRAWYPPRPERRPAFALAAAAALAAALGLGVYLGSSSSARDDAEDLAALRGEIRSLRATVALALLSEPSASERLSGVAYGRELQSADDRVAEALYATFLDDPNVNVRLAALDALRERVASPEVKKRLLEAIPAQDSPLVQLSAIDVVLEDAGGADNVAARAGLEHLAEDPSLDAVVRGYLVDRLERSP